MGVGDGHVATALGVAQRPRVGAGRGRPDLQRALGRQPGDGAAAGADGDDVDHRDLAGIDADRALGRQRGLTVDDDGDVGRRTAAVTGQHPVEPRLARDQRGAERPRGRPGQHGGDRLVHDLVGTEHTAVGLHHVERHAALPGERVQPLLDGRDVARHPGLDRRVDQRRHRALVLAVLAQHLAAHRHDGVGVLLGQDLAHPLLVRGIGVRVHQAHTQRADPLVAEPARDRARTVLVERADLVAGVGEPAPDRLHQVAGHDPVGLHPEVGVAVAVGHRLAGDLEDELVALRGDEPDRVDLALEQLVGGHRGAVADRTDRVPAAGRQSQQAEHLVDAGQEAVGRIGRCGRGLGGHQPAARLVEGDDVGERATGVDADTQPRLVGHACDSSGRVRRPRLIRSAGPSSWSPARTTSPRRWRSR